MIDDDGGPAHERLAMLYDWFKHLTSLSLLTLGGVLSIVQGADVPIKKPVLFVVIGLTVISGIFAFSGAGQVVDCRLKGTPLPESIKINLGIIGVSLSGALGAFVYIFVSTLR